MSESRFGHIVGKVEYREGDGPQILIRPGPVELVLTAADVTLSWTDGETRGTAAMPLTEFTRYRTEGAIVYDPAQTEHASKGVAPCRTSTAS